jgi:hypothetical protein
MCWSSVLSLRGVVLALAAVRRIGGCCWRGVARVAHFIMEPESNSELNGTARTITELLLSTGAAE